MRLRRWIRSRLHRRIFVWFGASIVATGASVWLAVALITPPHRTFREDLDRIRRYVGHQYAFVWDDSRARDRIGRAMAEDLHIGVVLRDREGAPIAAYGPTCAAGARELEAPVERDGVVLGRLQLCVPRERRGGSHLVVVVIVACATLWAFSGIIARRIARPIEHVTRVAHDIGQGKLGSRVGLGRRMRIGEIGVLADAIDEMASRIEKQVRDQRELLAAVSHEIRTPLGHVRILLDGAREAAERGEPLDPKICDEIEREVLEIDDLVGELLASSRLSFDAIERRPLDAVDLGARALERAGLPRALLASESASIPLVGDATLLGRALANVLDNARRHAAEVQRLRVFAEGGWVTFAVDDAGPGFGESELGRVFEPFYRGERRAGSLGLGLALVRRIAEAHGGRAWAENRPGGASVAFCVRATPSTEGTGDPGGRLPVAGGPAIGLPRNN